MKSPEASDHVEAMTSAYEYLKQQGFKPKLNILDNQCSKLLQKYIENDRVCMQTSERSRENNPNSQESFCCRLWDELLKQAEISLNLLRTSRYDPKKLVYEVLHGPFDYNRTPLAPPGTKALVFSTPNKHLSREQHAKDAWYVGPAMAHYRCKRFW
ncbi:hypothetical protein ACHAWF_000544, partial [Thalassiosira exigua]